MKRISFLLLLSVLFFGISCDDDDDGGNTLELRDEAEVRDENATQIEDFLATHFYRFETNPSNDNYQRIVFDTIAGENINETPILDSDLLDSKTVVNNDIEYELYYLKFREGAPSERQPKFADSTLVTYEGFTLEGEVFDVSPNAVWFDLTQVVRGFYEVLPEFRGSTGLDENLDGTITFNDDFGIGAVFIPSGLGYFASPPITSGIGAYNPIIFSFQLYRSNESDHDRDGIPSWMEDVNNDRRLNNDDTDGDTAPNYLDNDDDNDGVLTINEIIIDEQTGEPSFPDSNGNGTPDYLDETFSPEVD
ncbi:FKBP-type peptidyl-prolyl cis-trans isomerase [Psychroflexus salarius]|nr:hypothetical protein [Psychroflexus salarius]